MSQNQIDQEGIQESLKTIQDAILVLNKKIEQQNQRLGKMERNINISQSAASAHIPVPPAPEMDEILSSQSKDSKEPAFGFIKSDYIPSSGPEYDENLRTPQKKYAAKDNIGKIEELSSAKQEIKKNTSTENRNLEFKFGGKIFTGIGAVAVTFGIGYFLRYAFENNLINETMRVVLGIFAGLAMLGVGEFTRKKFSTYSQILTGGGLGILYLSLYGAFGYYHIISQTTAFVGMIIVTAAGVALAVRYDSLVLAIFSQVGGFLTPNILSTGENHPHALFLYIALLDLGIFSIAWWKLWRSLVFVGFAGTILMYLGWFATFYSESQLAVAESYATLFFAIFMGMLLVHHFIRKASQNSGDLALVTINSGLYFLLSYGILNEQHHDLMGLFTAALAVFHFALALIIKNDSDISSRFRQFLVSIGIVLSAIAIPIQFDKHWITIGWAIEALVLTYLGFQIKSKMLRIFADGIYLLSFIRLIFFDSVLSGGATPWLNDRVFSFVFCIAAFILAVVIYAKKKNEIEADETPIIHLLSLLTGTAFLVGGSTEIMDFFSHHWLSAFWSVGFAIIFAFAFLVRSVAVRVFASIVALVALTRLLSIDVDLPSGAQAYFNIRVILFLISAISAMAVLMLYNVFKEKITKEESAVSSQIISIYAYILTIWLFSAEIIDFHPKYWLPITWSAVALSAGWISFRTKNIILRLAAYVTFGIVFFRLLGFESNVNLKTYTPFFNTRMLSFAIATLSMGTFIAMIRKADVSKDEKQIVSVSLFLATNFLLIWLVSVEFMDYFKQQFSRLPEYLKSQQRNRYENLENVSLSVGWTIYSIILLALGILKKSTISRLLAIFIFGIVIFKVFLFDTSSLDTLYKFISFLTLGVILLLTGFLYNKYKERIMEFIKT